MIPAWKNRSLRFRLAAWYSLSGIVLISLFSLSVYFFVKLRMAQPLDGQLRKDQDLVRSKLSITPEGKVLWNGKELITRELRSWRDPWFEVWDGKENLRQRVWPLEESTLDDLPFCPALGRETLSVFSLAPDLRIRAFSAPLKVRVEGREEEWMLRVMRLHERNADALSSLLLIIAIALPTVVSLMVVGGYAVTRRWLSPLDEMVNQAEKIGVDNLSQRLPADNGTEELGRLAVSFNTTLARLEDSFRALDQFSADASHELRTPLTTLRSVGELSLQTNRSPEEYRESIASMLEEAERLQSLVERLLHLARASGGKQAVENRPTRLDQVVSDCVREMIVLAEEKEQEVIVTVEPCELPTDPLLYRQVVQNLLDNAIKFSPEGAKIRVGLRVEADEAVLTVLDNGPGITPGLEGFLTDRFFRADESRARESGGFGLGLSLTKAYAKLLNGKLAYESVKPHGSIFSFAVHR